MCGRRCNFVLCTQTMQKLVSHVMVDETTRKVQGVALADGTELHSSVVLSNATPYKTFVATTKINVAVDTLPQFHCCKNSNPEGGPEHMGTIHIGSERILQ